MMHTHEWEKKFIYLVQERPPLYNLKLKEYYNKDISNNLWKEVADNINLPVKLCKNKWTKIRNCYARYLRNRKENYTVKYHLSDTLAFLEKYMKSYKTGSGNSSDECNRESPRMEFITGSGNSSDECNRESPRMEFISKMDEYDDDDEDTRSASSFFRDDETVEVQADIIKLESRDDDDDIEENMMYYEDMNGNNNDMNGNRPSLQSSLDLSRPHKRTRDHDHLDHAQNEAINYSRKNDTGSPNLQESSFVDFAKSLLPEFQQLSSRRQRIFKQKTLTLLNSLLDEQETEIH